MISTMRSLYARRPTSPRAASPFSYMIHRMWVLTLCGLDPLNACPNCVVETVMGCPRCDDACEYRKIIHPDTPEEP
ncbi:hypothetical protein SAMN05216275_11365 [Streptosporangium canum]|uniref:Uncharacterized protein n=1 Tax=Streptosporangium canum TaxID=324952 RepID=A0A1I3USB0_9ACTN|nr:hypothetical protein SAMN05216275_11365 [Streptosporangium canum]